MLGAILGGATLGTIGAGVGIGSWLGFGPRTLMSSARAFGSLAGNINGLTGSINVPSATAASVFSPYFNSGLTAAEMSEAPGYLYDPGYTAGFGANLAASAISAPTTLFSKSLKASFYLQTLPRISQLLMGQTVEGPLTPFGLRGLVSGGASQIGGRLRGFFAGSMLTGSPIGGLATSGLLSRHVFQRTSYTGLEGYIRKLLKQPSFIQDSISAYSELSSVGITSRYGRSSDVKFMRGFEKINETLSARFFEKYAKGIGNFIGIPGVGLPLNTLKYMFDLARGKDIEGGKLGKILSQTLSQKKEIIKYGGRNTLSRISTFERIQDTILGPQAENSFTMKSNISKQTKQFAETMSNNIDDIMAKQRSGLVGRMAGVQLANILRYKYIWGTISSGVGTAVNQAVNTVNQVVQVARNMGKMEFGTGRTLDTQVASTERSRAISAMQNIGISARSYLGQEAAIMAG